MICLPLISAKIEEVSQGASPTSQKAKQTGVSSSQIWRGKPAVPVISWFIISEVGLPRGSRTVGYLRQVNE